MATPSKIPLDARICSYLSSQKALDSSSIKKLSLCSREDAKDIIGSMLVRAFGTRVMLVIPLELETKYLEWKSIAEDVHRCMMCANPLADDKTFNARCEKIKLSKAYVQKEKMLEVWQRQGVKTRPRPLHKVDPSSHFYKDALDAQREIDQMVTVLYRYYEDPKAIPGQFPYILLPLANSTALKHPERDLTWFDVVILYQGCVQDGAEITRQLLEKYPFRSVAEQLPKPPDSLGKMQYPFQRLRPFVAQMTVVSMEFFFQNSIPEEVTKLLIDRFTRDEALRMDLICFVSHLYKKIQKDPLFILPEESYETISKKKDRSLYISSLIILRIQGVVFWEGFTDSTQQIVLWAFKTNRKYLQNLDKFQYLPSAQKCSVKDDAINPRVVIPLICSLSLVYEKSEESFEENALALLMGYLRIPEDDYSDVTQVILLFYRSPYFLISTKQILDYLIKDRKKELHSMKTLYVEFEKMIPHQVKGETEAFFDCLPKSELGSRRPISWENEEILRRMAAFNACLNLSEEDEVKSSLYFSALGAFIRCQLTPSHFDLIFLYLDQLPPMRVNEVLSLFLHTAQRVHKGDILLPPNASFWEAPSPAVLDKIPSLLNTALCFAHKVNALEIRQVVSLFEENILDGKKMAPQDIRLLYFHVLSPLSDILDHDHLKRCLEFIKKVKHPFTLFQKLYIFYELLSLQNNPEGYEILLNWVSWIEKIMEIQLDPKTVTILLTYHPQINFDQIQKDYDEREKIGDRVDELIDSMRDPTRDQQLLEDPVPGPNRLEALKGYFLCLLKPLHASLVATFRTWPYGVVTLEQVHRLLDGLPPGFKNYSEMLIDKMPLNLSGESSLLLDIFLEMFEKNDFINSFKDIDLYNQWFYAQCLESEIVDVSLYLSTLRAYLNGKISRSHFEVLQVFESRYPHLNVSTKLSLMIQAVEEPLHSGELILGFPPIDPRKEEEPFDLLTALHLASEKRTESLEAAIPFIEKRVLSRPMTLEEKWTLYVNPLLSIEGPITEERVVLCLKTMQTMNFPFIGKERVYVFYHLLALSDNPLMVVDRVLLIKALEKTQGHRLGTYFALLLLTHDQEIDYLGFFEVLKRFIIAREDVFSLVEAPMIPHTHHDEVEEIVYDLSKPLKVDSRPDLFGQVRAFFCNASIYKPIHHVLGTFPQKVESMNLLFPLFSANDALVPLDFHHNSDKGMVTSWELSHENVVATVTLISMDTFTSYSQTVTLPLSVSHYDSFDPILSLLECCFYHFGYDRRDDSSTPSESFADFRVHPKLQQILAHFALEVEDQEKLLRAFHLFLTSLRRALRKNLIHLIQKCERVCPSEISMEQLLSYAVSGPISPYKEFHSLIPTKELIGLVPSMQDCYTSSHEMEQFDCSELFETCQVLEEGFAKLCRELRQEFSRQWKDELCQRMSTVKQVKKAFSMGLAIDFSCSLMLECSFEIRPTYTHFKNEPLLSQGEDKLTHEEEAFEVSIKGSFLREEVFSKKTYPTKVFLQDQEMMKRILSWQVMHFKHIFYQKMHKIYLFIQAIRNGRIYETSFTLSGIPYPIRVSQDPIMPKNEFEVSYRCPHYQLTKTIKMDSLEARSFYETLEGHLDQMRLDILSAEEVQEKEEKVFTDVRPHNFFKDILGIAWLIYPKQASKGKIDLGQCYSSRNEMGTLQNNLAKNDPNQSRIKLSFTRNGINVTSVPVHATYKEGESSTTVEFVTYWFGCQTAEIVHPKRMMKDDYLFCGQPIKMTLNDCEREFVVSDKTLWVPLSYSMTALKLHIYQTLPSLQIFLETLTQKKKDAVWTDLFSSNPRQIKGVRLMEKYRFTFIEDGKVGPRKKEVEVLYSLEMEREFDLLLFLNNAYSEFLYGPLSYPFKKVDASSIEGLSCIPSEFYSGDLEVDPLESYRPSMDLDYEKKENPLGYVEHLESLYSSSSERSIDISEVDSLLSMLGSDSEFPSIGNSTSCEEECEE